MPAGDPVAAEWHPTYIQGAQNLLNVPIQFTDDGHGNFDWREARVASVQSPDMVAQVAVTNSSSTSQTSSTSTATTTGTSNASDTLSQTTVIKAFDYRNPKVDNRLRYNRSRADLDDERVSQFVLSQQLPFLETFFDNDRQAMDLDVRRFQLAVLSSYLVPPISGVITGLYKDAGDYVRAGEPVLRIENEEQILLVGSVKHRNVLQLGQAVTVSTKIFDSGITKTLYCTVVAIRGHDSVSQEWDVILCCSNREAGKPIFPINYSFDYLTTTVTF